MFPFICCRRNVCGQTSGTWYDLAIIVSNFNCPLRVQTVVILEQWQKKTHSDRSQEVEGAEDLDVSQEESTALAALIVIVHER